MLGCGPIGLFTIGIARASGAARRSSRPTGRRSGSGLAEKMGASATVNVDETPDTAGWFLEQNEGLGFDVVFEMSGSPRAIADSFRIARNGGRVILFGIPARPVEIDVAQALIFKNLNVLALNGRKIFETWYRTRWLLESGVVDVRPLITKELPLEEYEEAFALLAAGEACKIVVYPGGRAPSRGGRSRCASAFRSRGGGSTDDVARLRLAPAGAAPAMSVAAAGSPRSARDRRSTAARAELDGSARRTYKRFNTLCSPQGPVVEMEGRGEVLVLSSNNYLGLADRPEVVEAGIEGLRRYGAGTASVRFICGTFEPHLELERELAELVGTEAALTYVSCWNANEACDPEPDRRLDGDPLGRAQPRVDHRRGPAGEAGAEGGLQALRHGRPARASSSRSSPGSARS